MSDSFEKYFSKIICLEMILRSKHVVWNFIYFIFFRNKRLRRKRAKFERSDTNWKAVLCPGEGLNTSPPTYRTATLPNTPIALYLASSAMPISNKNKRLSKTLRLDRA